MKENHSKGEAPRPQAPKVKPDYIRVSKCDTLAAGWGDPRVDLNKCEFWVQNDYLPVSRYSGEAILYQTRGGRWLIVHSHYDDFTMKSSRHAWWAYPSEVDEMFLENPEIEPPPDIAARLARYDVTDMPPEPSPSPADDSCPVDLNDVDRPLVRGKEAKRLTTGRSYVIQALVEKWPNGLSKDDLPKRSGCPDAVNMLKKLTKACPIWASVILLPGPDGRGLGYRIASR